MPRLIVVCRALTVVALASASSTSLRAAGDGLTGHGGPIRAMAVLSDGATLVTAGFDSAIIVWDVARGTARRVLRFHEGAVNALAALREGCFASGGEDTRIAIWCGEGSTPARVLSGHTGPVSALSHSPEGQMLASASWDGTIRLWGLNDPAQPTRVIEGHKGPVNGVAFLGDGLAVASVGYEGQVRLTYLDASRAPLSRVHAAPLNAVVATGDGQILAAGADGRVLLYGADLAIKGELALDQGPLTTLALSADGPMLAAAGMRTPVTLIDRDGLRVRSQILGPGLPVWALAFSGGKMPELFTGGADRAVRRWDVATGEPSGGQIAAAEPADTAKDDVPGARVYRACKACHGLTAADTNRAGPTLHGLFGRRIATAPGFAYSDALRNMDIVWTPETVSRLFEIGPNAYTPGTKMPEQRITDPEDREALTAWLARVTAPAVGDAKP
jgi:cytochrome c